MRYLWIVLSIAVLTPPAHAADATFATAPPAWASVSKAQQPRLAKGGANNGTIPLRPLDDPANPFAGKYDAADRWAYEHYIPYPTEEEKQQYVYNWGNAEFRRQFPEHWMFTTARVDENGWMVPRELTYDHWSPLDSVKTIREYAEKAWTASDEWTTHTQQRTNKYPYEFWAVGVFPPEISKQQSESYYDKEAPNMPHIPAWLGRNPPLQTVFVPNGEIVTYGPLGLHIDRPAGSISWNAEYAPGEYWYRYSAEGKLLTTQKSRAEHHGPPLMDDWQDVYANWPAFEKNLRDQGILDFSFTQLSKGGRVLVRMDHLPDPVMPNSYTSRLREVLGAYDYAGSPLDLDGPWEKDSQLYGVPLGQSQVAQMYESQVRLGLTDPNAKSPYSGTSQGPLSVDPTPRPAKRIAYLQGLIPFYTGGQVRANIDWIEVKPLDDPANPYRAQYGPWDRWLLEQHGKQDPAGERQMHENEKRANQELAKARAENRKPDSKILAAMGGYAPTGGWTFFQVAVDKAGYPIPFVQQRAAIAQRRLEESRDLRKVTQQVSDWDNVTDYMYHAGGSMPEEMRAALNSALQQAVPELPQLKVPEWMRANPPYGFITGPNGEYITVGALGSYEEGWMNIPREQRRGPRGYYRYSSTGELLGQVPPDQPLGWATLYNPNAPSLEMSGKAQGFEVQTDRGFLLWRNTKEQGGAVVAAWNYDGTELSLDKPLARQPGEFAFVWWEDVLRGDNEAMLQ